MANTIKLKSRAADATAPTTGNLADREVAISIPGKTIYINDAGTIRAIANLFEDAPSDGTEYVRKDAAWVSLPSGGGGGNVPKNVQNNNYTFVAGDVGKMVCKDTTTARTYTLNNSVFSAGDWIAVANFAGLGSITVSRGSGVTLYLAGSINNASRTVFPRGVATIYMESASVGYLFGSGVG